MKKKTTDIQKVDGAIVGSMKQNALKKGIDLASAWLDVDQVVLCDVSGSMEAQDSRDNQSRYKVMTYELGKIQNRYPGRVAVFSFSDKTTWNPDGIPSKDFSMTNLAGALEFLYKQEIDDLGVGITVISDGQPDDPEEALRIARKFKTPIDTIFVGASNGYGKDFLRDLARKSGGKYTEDFTMKENLLGNTLETKLLASESSGTISL